MKTETLEIQYIALDALSPSPTNPRKNFDPKVLKDLAASLKEKGVLQPLIVRKLKSGHEIVSGESRYRAAKQAGLEKVPCTVRDLTDQEVVEFQVIENVQRHDLTPLEEASGYRLLHDEHGYDWDDLAAKIGKSKSYIYRRLQLLSLSPEVQKALDAGLPPSYAEALLTVAGYAKQDQLLKRIQKKGHPSIDNIKELRQAIEEERLDLSRAPFDITDAELYSKAGACGKCPKRTSAQADLLGETGKNDCCLDSMCWAAKVVSNNQRLVEKAKSDPNVGEVLVVTEGKNFEPYGKGLVKLNEQGSLSGLKGKTTAAAALRRAGTEVKTLVVIEDGKPTIYAKEKDVAAALPRSAFENWSNHYTNKKGQGGGAEDKAESAKRKKRLLDLKAARQAWPAAWVKVIDSLAAKELKGPHLGTFLDLLVNHFGIDYHVRHGIHERLGKDLKKATLEARDDLARRKVLWQILLGSGLSNDGVKLAGGQYTNDICAAPQMFKLASVDWDVDRAKAATEIAAARKAKTANKVAK